jgi:hypothetical protein
MSQRTTTPAAKRKPVVEPAQSVTRVASRAQPV